jgi:hypothetical protein
VYLKAAVQQRMIAPPKKSTNPFFEHFERDSSKPQVTPNEVKLLAYVCDTFTKETENEEFELNHSLFSRNTATSIS